MAIKIIWEYKESKSFIYIHKDNWRLILSNSNVLHKNFYWKELESDEKISTWTIFEWTFKLLSSDSNYHSQETSKIYFQEIDDSKAWSKFYYSMWVNELNKLLRYNWLECNSEWIFKFKFIIKLKWVTMFIEPFSDKNLKELKEKEIEKKEKDKEKTSSYKKWDIIDTKWYNWKLMYLWKWIDIEVIYNFLERRDCKDLKNIKETVKYKIKDHFYLSLNWVYFNHKKEFIFFLKKTKTKLKWEVMNQDYFKWKFKNFERTSLANNSIFSIFWKIEIDKVRKQVREKHWIHNDSYFVITEDTTIKIDWKDIFEIIKEL